MTMHRKLCLTLIYLLLLSAPISAQELTDYLVRWQPNTEPSVTHYIIYRSKEYISNYDSIAAVYAPDTTYLDTNLDKDAAYYYKIIAVTSDGLSSSFSNLVSGFTISQTAPDPLPTFCMITDFSRNADGSYDVGWSTASQTIGFIQYGDDGTFDSISEWDRDSYSGTHRVNIAGLLMPRTYIMRAVSYDEFSNMYVSAVETLEVVDEDPVYPTAPLLSIYPVPYHPNMGTISFNNLPAGSSIYVFDGNGKEVWSKNVGTETITTWDGRNIQGSYVMSGVYYVLIKNSTGAVVDKRTIMIVH